MITTTVALRRHSDSNQFMKPKTITEIVDDQIVTITTTTQPFDWLLVLSALDKGILQETWNLAQDLLVRAKDWPTCACGQLCKLLPRNLATGSPVDGQLCCLGVSFYDDVKNRQWALALARFEEIEKRATLLLKQQSRKAYQEYGV